MGTIIVEKENPERFFPLTHTRATFELRYGAWCPLDRAIIAAEKRGLKVALLCRPLLEEYQRAKTGLPVNADIDGEPFSGLPAQTPWKILAQSDQLIIANWEQWNESQPATRRALPRGVHLIGSRSDIYLSPSATIQPGCILDVSGGPIIIAKGTQIKSSQIVGASFIGANCVVNGARLRPGTSLGPHCKLAGEVSASIFQSRVNKAHEGFVGHNCAGRWVNFGAMATTSNLKNTYGNTRYQQTRNTTIETGVQFLGSLIGIILKLALANYYRLAPILASVAISLAGQLLRNIFRCFAGLVRIMQKNIVLKNVYKQFAPHWRTAMPNCDRPLPHF